MFSTLNVNQVLERIKNKGYNCFVSEAQLRDVFAIELKSIFSKYTIFPEFTPWKNPDSFVFGDKKISFDLLAKCEKEKIAFEFKYKTKAFETILFDEKIRLNNQEDTTNGRFDVWEDIYRLEQFVRDKQLSKGFFIFITNYPTYFAEPRPGVASEPFSIAPGEHKATIKKWGNATIVSKDNNYALDIFNDYVFNYVNYSQIGDEKFYLLVVEVK